MENPPALIFSTAICFAGVIGGVAYLVLRSRRDDAAAGSMLAGRRPWRPIGALLVVVVSLLTYGGLNLIDHRLHPAAYLALWGLVMLLTICLGVLAVIDVIYTRRLLRRAMERSAGQ